MTTTTSHRPSRRQPRPHPRARRRPRARSRATTTAAAEPAATDEPDDEAEDDEAEDDDDESGGDFCAANEQFGVLLGQLPGSPDPEEAWDAVEDQFDEVLDALPPELEGGADVADEYYDELEDALEDADWNVSAVFENPPEMSAEMAAFETQVNGYTDANC